MLWVFGGLSESPPPSSHPMLMTHSNRKQPTILITGATDGLGLALARHAANVGWRLVLVGRRPLATFTDPLFTPHTYCQTDLSQPDSGEQIAAFCHSNGITALNYLVHNAGVGYVGEIEAQDAASVQELVAVNLTAPIRITQPLLPLLKAANGKMVVVSSVVAPHATPRYAVYTATKSALEGWARNLRIELAGQVQVQVLMPGAIRTAMHRKTGMPESRSRRFPPPEKIATDCFKAMTKDDRNHTIGNAINRMVRGAGKRFGGVLEATARTFQRPVAPYAPAGQPPVVLITGFADGIGRALAFRFARAGYIIIGVDRDVATATDTCAALRQQGGQVRFHHADLANLTSLESLLADLHQEFRLDVLIHNAGISAAGAYENIPISAQMAVVAVNFMAPLVLTAGLLKHKRLAAGARVVFIASLSHYVGYPGAATYAATKDGIVSYARSLAVAVAGWGMSVLTVFPGPTRTAHARRYSPDNRREASRMSPERVADGIFRAVQRRERRLILGIGNQLMALLGTVAPRLTEWLMKKTLFEKMDEVKVE